MDREDTALVRCCLITLCGLLLFVMLAKCVSAQPAVRQSHTTPNPPIIVRLQGEAWVRTPAGMIYLPEGGEVWACVDVNRVLQWDVDGRVMQVVRPCAGIFASGFE